MFYPLESLRRGGKFYMYWMADCYPHKLSIKMRNTLWDKDIRVLCCDLEEVIVTESGTVSNRFSLRLSAQLLRGLVRLYDKKLSLFLDHLCMFSAKMWKYSNMMTESDETHELRKRGVQERRRRVRRVLPPVQQGLLEALQNSGNAVARVDDITLREDNLPPRQLPVDGFGEEPQDMYTISIEALELMRAPETSMQHHSGMDVLDVTDRTRDHTRTMLQPQMENIQEANVSMYNNKSMGVGEIAMDLQPEIPPIPAILPELPVPNVQEMSQEMVPGERELDNSALIHLEELECVSPRQRKSKHLIVDKAIKISNRQMKTQLQKISLKSFSENRVKVDKLPVHILLHGSAVVNSALRNTGKVDHLRVLPQQFKNFFQPVKPKMPTASNETRKRTASVHLPLEKSPVQQIPEIEMEVILQPGQIECEMHDISKQAEVSDIPTQVLQELQAHQPGVRVPEQAQMMNRPRVEDELEQSQNKRLCVRRKNSLAPSREHEKENFPYVERPTTSKSALLDTSAHPQPMQIDDEIAFQVPETDRLNDSSRRCYRRSDRANRDSDSSEQLGSLDRTKVSLETHNEESDTLKYLNEEWGSEAMYKKIVITRRLKPKEQIDVHKLVRLYPSSKVSAKFMATKCFTSILKLYQHGYLKLVKNPLSLEIIDINVTDKIAP